MNIIDAIKDPQLFKPFFGDNLRSWRPWFSALRALYGIRPLTPFDEQMIAKCTGRDPEKLPTEGFTTALFLCGRRSGKSRIASVIGAYEAALAGRERKLDRGERGLVVCCSPTKTQSSVERSYMAALFEPEMLRAEVVREVATGFDLANGISVEILQGDFRTVRNFTTVAVVISEAAFFGLEDGAKVKSDTELIRALKPGLATTGGKLIAISSPYAKRGWCYRTWKTNFGNDAGKTLVWNTDSRTMNPTLPESVIDDAIAEDLQAAKTEYLGEFRDDVVAFVPREAVERLVIPGRRELMPRLGCGIRYFAFVDVTGGRHDDHALAIAHRKDEKIVLDRAIRWSADSGSPQMVVRQMADELKRFGLRSTAGDNFAAEWVAEAFRNCGIKYHKSPKNKNELYRELLPMLFSDQVELLDDPVLIDQLAALERRTRSGGKDVIDHPKDGKDDLANAVAGVVVNSSQRVLTLGAF